MREGGLQCLCLCRAPEGLYEGGLQRDLFMPFIERLSRETRVHDISSSIDYRRLAHHSQASSPVPKVCLTCLHSIVKKDWHWVSSTRIQCVAIILEQRFSGTLELAAFLYIKLA